MVKHCCICKLQYAPDVTFHKIPKSEEVKLKWFAVIGRELKNNNTVCSNHFNEEDFSYKVVGGNVKRFLLPKAVPIIHGHSDSGSVQRQTINPNINKDNNNDTKSNDNSDDDVTLENQQDLTILKKSLLKRQSSDAESLTSVKRARTHVCNPRYIGDLTREDFTSDIAYRTVNDHLNNCKKKNKVLTQKVRRLIKKVESLQSLLNHLKENGLITTEGSIKNAWNKLLPFLSNVNNSEQSSNHKLQETIQAIIEGNIALSEVKKCLSTCAEMEEETVEDNEENVETMFEQLILWAKNEPKHIRMQVQYLKNVHYKT